MPQSTASPDADQYGRNSKLSGREEETVLKEQGPSGFWWVTSKKPPWPCPHSSARARTVKFTCWVPTPLHQNRVGVTCAEPESAGGPAI